MKFLKFLFKYTLFSFFLLIVIAFYVANEKDANELSNSNNSSQSNSIVKNQEVPKSQEDIERLGQQLINSRYKSNAYQSRKTDRTNATLTLRSVSNGLINRYERKFATLNFICADNKTNFYIDLDGAFLVGDTDYNQQWGKVQYRLDDDPTSAWNMIESTDNAALGLWNGSGITAIKSMFGKHLLKIWITPFNENEVFYEFVLDDVEKRIGNIRKHCNW